MTATQIDNMSAATEAVKQALIGVTQDGGCKPETIALVTEAVSTWETVESLVCAELRQKLGEAQAVIKALHTKLEEQQQDAGYQSRQHAKFINEATATRATDATNVRHWREEVGKLQCRVKGLTEQLGKLTEELGRQCDLTGKLDEELKKVEEENRRSIRIAYDPAKSQFTVTFRHGQQLHFDRPKNVAGNVENWLAVLRHQVTE